QVDHHRAESAKPRVGRQKLAAHALRGEQHEAIAIGQRGGVVTVEDRHRTRKPGALRASAKRPRRELDVAFEIELGATPELASERLQTTGLDDHDALNRQALESRDGYRARSACIKKCAQP